MQSEAHELRCAIDPLHVRVRAIAFPRLVNLALANLGDVSSKGAQSSSKTASRVMPEKHIITGSRTGPSLIGHDWSSFLKNQCRITRRCYEFDEPSSLLTFPRRSEPDRPPKASPSPHRSRSEMLGVPVPVGFVLARDLPRSQSCRARCHPARRCAGARREGKAVLRPRVFKVGWALIALVSKPKPKGLGPIHNQYSEPFRDPFCSIKSCSKAVMVPRRAPSPSSRGSKVRNCFRVPQRSRP